MVRIYVDFKQSHEVNDDIAVALVDNLRHLGYEVISRLEDNTIYLSTKRKTRNLEDLFTIL